VLEHPVLVSINRTGYPENLVAQPEHCGTDYYNTELLPGDDVAEVDGDTVHIDNLERFLAEQYGFVFKTIE